jgi:hypothetical protein
MKALCALLWAIAMSAFIGCRTTPTSVSSVREFNGLPPTDFTVSVSGTPGLRFIGRIGTDGATREVAGTVPATYQVNAHKLACSFKKTEVDGDLVLRVAAGDKDLGSSNSRTRFGGVRAEIVPTSSGRSTVFTGF